MTTTVPSTSNKISAVGLDSYTYDAAGNITDDDTNTYTWNAAGDLATVNTTGGVYTYGLGPYARREGRGREHDLTMSMARTGEFVRRVRFVTLGKEYVYLNSETSGRDRTRAGPKVLTYLHTDHLGTPRVRHEFRGDAVRAGPPTPSASAAPPDRPRSI